MRFFTCLTDDHNLWLVGLAAVLCLIGSVITFRLFRRLGAAEKGTRLAWSFMGAVATGATIWCTHFVAMIAYQPGTDISYEPLLTGLSLGVAMAGSGLALWAASRAMRWSAELGGVLFGLTVVAMHYTGMAGFATDAVIHWSPAYVAASIVGAVVFGGLAFNRARRSGKAAPVVLMVLGIVALHFTGMAAMTVIPLGSAADHVGADSANVVLAFAVAAVGLMMLGTGVATYVLDMQFRIQAKARLEHLLESSVDGMVVEQDGVILAANAAFADVVAGSAVVQVKNSHFIHSCVSVSFGMSVALLGPTCAFRRSRTIAGGAMLLCRNRMAFWEPVSKPLITLNFYRTLATVPAKPR